MNDPRLPRRLAAADPGWTHETDVVVVGSGIAGLSAALHARSAGGRFIIFGTCCCELGTEPDRYFCQGNEFIHVAFLVGWRLAWLGRPWRRYQYGSRGVFMGFRPARLFRARFE